MKTIFIYPAAIVVLLSIMIGCNTLTVRPQLATRILTENNFTEITIKPWGIQNAFVCSEDDIFRARFSAKNISGKVVDGVVCSGFFKGSTVRVF
jgi:hypothetical protein